MDFPLQRGLQFLMGEVCSNIGLFSPMETEIRRAWAPNCTNKILSGEMWIARIEYVSYPNDNVLKFS